MAKKSTEKKSLEMVDLETVAITEAHNEILGLKQIEHDSQMLEKAKLEKVETESLIASVYKEIGRAEGLNAVSEFATVSGLIILKKVKEEKLYKEIPNIQTWENLCKSIGFSRAKIDEDLQNLETFGEDFLLTVSRFGIGYRELRKLRKATADSTLSITDSSISIGGEVVNLADKDDVKDMLERLVSSKDEVIKAKDETIAAKDERIKRLNTDIERERDEVDKLNKVDKKQDKQVEDSKDFNTIRDCENKFLQCFMGLSQLAEKDLTEKDQHFLGGVVMLILQMGEEIKTTLNSREGTVYLDRMFMTDTELEQCNKMITPLKIEGRQ